MWPILDDYDVPESAFVRWAFSIGAFSRNAEKILQGKSPHAALGREVLVNVLDALKTIDRAFEFDASAVDFTLDTDVRKMELLTGIYMEVLAMREELFRDLSVPEMKTFFRSFVAMIARYAHANMYLVDDREVLIKLQQFFAAISAKIETGQKLAFFIRLEDGRYNFAGV